MANPDMQTLEEALQQVRTTLPALRNADDDQFECIREQWLATVEAMKDAVFHANPKQKHPDRHRFELGSGAQSIQFMIDILPHLQRCMKQHYERDQTLSLLDIGAGSGAGDQLLTQLHSDIVIWSRLDVTAIDHVPWRRRWVAMNHPRVDYRVMSSSELPDRRWDLVVCSHVIEHLQQPRAMIADALRACRGFAFVYAPYAEHELSPGHVSVITESTFASFEPIETHILESMGFSGPGRRCILAIFDRRHRHESAGSEHGHPKTSAA